MLVKLKFFIVFLFVSTFAFSQKTLEQKDSEAKQLTPLKDKAIVYILRPTAFGAIVKMNLECDSVHIGSTKAEKYVYTAISPGHHLFVSKAENTSSFEVDLEAGKIYYIKQQVKMGLLFAETKLKLLDEEEGKKYLNKCKLSKDNVYSSD